VSAEPTVVLAHGAWADGSSWAKVITRLRAEGLQVQAVPLPLTSLPDDVAALDRTLERITGPVVLAGHAYAGAVIGAARSERVASLVYVTALAPDDGETVADVFYRAEPHPSAPTLAPDAHGLIWLPDEAFAAAFAPNATAEEQFVLASVQRPINVACIGEPSANPRWRELPSYYLVAQDDRMIAESTQKFMAKRMDAVVRVHQVDHTPLVTAPDAVASIISEALTAVRGGQVK